MDRRKAPIPMYRDRCRCGLFGFEGVDHFFDVVEAVVVAVVLVELAVLCEAVEVLTDADTGQLVCDIPRST